MSLLTVNVLGSPQMECDGVALSFATRKTQALLVYLAVTQAQPTRDGLATLLWPESSPSW
jgi:DNA-binding SARP family transcriptional activator